MKTTLGEKDKDSSSSDHQTNLKQEDNFKEFPVIWLITRIKELAQKRKEPLFQKIKLCLKVNLMDYQITLPTMFLIKLKNCSKSGQRGS